MPRAKYHKKNSPKSDIIIWIVIVFLLTVFIAEIPSIHNSFAFSAQKNTPIITEIMSSNKGTITDENGRYCDWIELYNPTDQPINLAGFSLTDDPEIPTPYVLPYRVLDPGEYALVYADDQASGGTGLHVPFKLKDKGETLVLFDSNGRDIQQISFPAIETDYAYALDIDTNIWSLTDRCTPGLPNTDDGYAAYQQTQRAHSPVIINEVMASNTLTLRDEDGDYSDWVEIYNSSTETIDLTGWGLSDTEASPKQWEFPDAQIAPGGYLVVFLSGKNRAVSGSQFHTDFKLDAFHDSILFTNLYGQIVSEVPINDVAEDMSYAMVPGSDEWRVYSQPTPGYPNTAEGWNALQGSLGPGTDSPIVISEVMSNNVSTLQDEYGEYPDWIEICNRSDSDVDLSGWGLTDDTGELGRWQFPSMILSPGEYLTVYASGRDSIVSKKKAHTDFSLAAEGDIAVLTDPADSVADYCRLPFLRTGLTYVRQPDGGFAYCDRPTPGAANRDGYTVITPRPVFSIQAGLYDEPQQVALTGEPNARIYYTLDGTVPDENSIPYTGPISIGKTTPVRAVAYLEGCVSSEVSCATYLIGEDIGLPVVSIVTDPANLFDEETGIYANGPGWKKQMPHYGANYWEDWERPAHLELLEPDGTVGISQDIGIKIFGGWSRAEEKKSFSLMSRERYGSRNFDYPVFPDLPYQSYKDLIIRNGGQDTIVTRIRNDLQMELARENTDLDIQAHRKSILFINGEFWGIYDLMEKMNEHFIAQHHGVNPDKIDFLEKRGDVIQGSNDEYAALLEYVRTHDLSVRENYEYVASRIDIDNYIDWCAIELYTANGDLSNIKFWKSQAPDGKWRWILYDLDWGFYYLYQKEREQFLDVFNIFMEPSAGNDREFNEEVEEYLDVFNEFLEPESGEEQQQFDNILIRRLLDNGGFKKQFIERFIYHCTVTFDPDAVMRKIDSLSAYIEPYIARDMGKWNDSPVETWDQVYLQLLRDFAADRPAINLRSMQEYFGLSDAEMERLISGNT